MTRAARVLFGYRDDLDLDKRWWHRLMKVTFFLGALWVTFQFWAQNTVSWHDERWNAGIAIANTITGLLIVAFLGLNLYFRGLVYIVCGPRRENWRER